MRDYKRDDRIGDLDEGNAFNVITHLAQAAKTGLQNGFSSSTLGKDIARTKKTFIGKNRLSIGYLIKKNIITPVEGELLTDAFAQGKGLAEISDPKNPQHYLISREQAKLIAKEYSRFEYSRQKKAFTTTMNKTNQATNVYNNIIDTISRLHTQFDFSGLVKFGEQLGETYLAQREELLKHNPLLEPSYLQGAFNAYRSAAEILFDTKGFDEHIIYTSTLTQVTKNLKAIGNLFYARNAYRSAAEVFLEIHDIHNRARLPYDTEVTHRLEDIAKRLTIRTPTQTKAEYNESLELAITIYEKTNAPMGIARIATKLLETKDISTGMKMYGRIIPTLARKVIPEKYQSLPPSPIAVVNDMDPDFPVKKLSGTRNIPSLRYGLEGQVSQYG